MTKKRVGILFGMEEHFPWALVNAINEKAGDEIEASPVEISSIRDDISTNYDLIVDRISHDVPFYRAYVKAAAACGATLINNPFWWSADDKFMDNLVARAAGVAVPKTVLLPHKEHPPNTKASSFRNMKFVEWDAVFEYLGFPIFLKPADGGGWRDVYKCDDPGEFFASYDRTRDLCMIAQEAIDFTDYFRCYVIGRERVHIMRYDPRHPHHERYVKDAPPIDDAMDRRLRRDCIALCEALGYDMNTVEFAVRDGVPYAIDFMNPAPDADPFSVGQENFDWVVDNLSDVVIDRVRHPRGFEPTGSWPQLLPVAKRKKAVKKKAATKKKQS